MNDVINDSLRVFLWYFFDCDHTFLVEIVSSIHGTISSTAKQDTTASLINVISVLNHTNI